MQGIGAYCLVNGETGGCKVQCTVGNCGSSATEYCTWSEASIYLMQILTD